MKVGMVLAVFVTGLVMLAAATASSVQGRDLLGLWLIGAVLTLAGGLTMLSLGSPPSDKK